MYLDYIIDCDNLSYDGMTNNFFNEWRQHGCIIAGGAKYTKKKGIIFKDLTTNICTRCYKYGVM